MINYTSCMEFQSKEWHLRFTVLEKEMQSKCFWLGFIFRYCFHRSPHWIALTSETNRFQFLCVSFMLFSYGMRECSLWLWALSGIDHGCFNSRLFSHIVNIWLVNLIASFRRSISIAIAINLCAYKTLCVLYAQVLLQKPGEEYTQRKKTTHNHKCQMHKIYDSHCIIFETFNSPPAHSLKN